MSQTETIMLVVLGFTFAALVALFIGRLAWRIALRLGARRMQRQVPTTVAELQAERDRLRAEYAMMSRKLELRLDDVKMRMAEQMAEVSRNRNRIETLMGEVSKREATIAEREAELGAARAKIADLENSISGHIKVQNKLGEAISAKESEIDRLSSSLVSLNDQVRGQDVRMEAAGGRVVRLNPDSEGSQDRLRRRIAELTSLSGDMAQSREKPSDGTVFIKPADSTTITAVTTRHAIETKLAEAEKETEELQQEIERLDQAWSKKLNQLAPQEPVTVPEAPQDTRQVRGIANVISLAQRIRALQKDIGS